MYNITYLVYSSVPVSQKCVSQGQPLRGLRPQAASNEARRRGAETWGEIRSFNFSVPSNLDLQMKALALHIFYSGNFRNFGEDLWN